jgi:hypothetical protein
MNYLSDADASLAGFQDTLSQYQATIAPPGTYSDTGMLLLIAGAVTVVLLLSVK